MIKLVQIYVHTSNLYETVKETTTKLQHIYKLITRLIVIQERNTKKTSGNAKQANQGIKKIY